MYYTREQIGRTLIKPAVSGAGGGLMVESLGTFGSFTVDADVPGLSLLNGQVWSPMLFGIVMGAATTVLTEGVANILHSIDRKHRTKHLGSFVTHIVGGAASWAFLSDLLSGSTLTGIEKKRLAVIGAASEIGAQWFHETFVEEGSLGSDFMEL